MLKKKKKKGGRPRLDFNWEAVEALMSLKASERYIAIYLLKKEGTGAHEIDEKKVASKIKLIQRRITERWATSFVQFRDQKQDDWKIELTQLQRASAKSGKIAMQIWLGKQDLGQSDKMEQRTDVRAEMVQIYVPKNGSESDGDCD